MTAESVSGRRAVFPRGMAQPEKGYRFGLDPLLLASYLSVRAGEKVLDLGTGCGVAGLALLLQTPEVRVTGVDISPEMIECAERNADLLGFRDHFAPLCLDIRDIRKTVEIRAESFDQVMVNPPYRCPGQGREPQNPSRREARFEIRAELDDFLQAASFVLKNRGTLTLIYLAARLGSVFQAVASTRLEIQRMRCVHSFLHSRASLVLVQARKNGKPGLECDPPLVLYENEARGQSRLSEQALTLCPFLGCNP